MSSPDFFGISDRIRQMTPPVGLEAVHEDGFTWARQGSTWNDTTRIGPKEWNYLIGNLRGIGLMPGAVSNDYDPAGPYVLREALFSLVMTRVDVHIAPFMEAVNDALALKAPLASPALTGTPTAPTAAGATNTTQVATTAFVQTGLATKAPLASPVFTGTPEAPTQSPGQNNTRIATTAFVTAAVDAIYGGIVDPSMNTLAEIVDAVNLKAPLASPALTGTPTAPTAAGATNTTQVATTAYVKGRFVDLDGRMEVGDWTPSFEGTTIPGSISYVWQVGKYVVVGRMVFVSFDVQAGAVFTTTPTGSLLIAGLPFASDLGTGALDAASIGRASTFVNLPANFSGWALRRYTINTTKLIFQALNSVTGALSNADANILTENTRFTGSLVYRRA